MSLTDAITRLADQVVWVRDEVARLRTDNARLRAEKVELRTALEMFCGNVGIYEASSFVKHRFPATWQEGNAALQPAESATGHGSAAESIDQELTSGVSPK